MKSVKNFIGGRLWNNISASVRDCVMYHVMTNVWVSVEDNNIRGSVGDSVSNNLRSPQLIPKSVMESALKSIS